MSAKIKSGFFTCEVNFTNSCGEDAINDAGIIIPAIKTKIKHDKKKIGCISFLSNLISQDFSFLLIINSTIENVPRQTAEIKNKTAFLLKFCPDIGKPNDFIPGIKRTKQ